MFRWVRRMPDSPGVFLTFDDGPDPEVTPRLLDLFDELRVRATFFVIGEKAVRHRPIVRRMLSAGHAPMRLGSGRLR